MEESINIAIVGLGRVGSTFLKKLTEYKDKGLNIVAVFEHNISSPGLRYAKTLGLKICCEEKEITDMSTKVDVIFNLTGDPSVENKMRLAQVALGNKHTVIVSRVMASLIWKMITEEKLPEHTPVIR